MTEYALGEEIIAYVTIAVAIIGSIWEYHNERELKLRRLK